VNSASPVRASPSVDSPTNMYLPSGNRARKSASGTTTNEGSPLSKKNSLSPCSPTLSLAVTFKSSVPSGFMTVRLR